MLTFQRGRADRASVPTTSLAPRRTGEQTRQAILLAAAEAFRDIGYDVATLEQIATRVGITRAAILHYFGTKDELLGEIVRPFMARLDALIDDHVGDRALTPRRQRELIVCLVDFLCDNRVVAGLLVRDITAHRHLDPSLQIVDRAARLVAIATRNNEEPHAGVAALAAVGAVVRPVSAPEALIDLSTPASRRVLVEASVAALREGIRAGRQ
jgi:AcrR family transcriptional regulator